MNTPTSPAPAPTVHTEDRFPDTFNGGEIVTPLRYSGDAYNFTQTNEACKDGDVVVSEDGVVGFLFKAWPVAVTEKVGELHYLKDSWPEDAEPCHVAGFKKAREVATELGLKLREHGFTL